MIPPPLNPRKAAEEQAPAALSDDARGVEVSEELGDFPLNGVIPGWTVGIPGMKVGGRRLLIIPPDQAYGAQPPSPDITPDDTLVFVIDLTEVQ